MSNEILLVLSIPVFFGGTLIFYKLFGRIGIYVWTVACLILANIEVQLMVNAFGMDMTLGNVCFASSFLATDILSEKYGKKQANTAVTIGIATSILFIVSTRLWLAFYTISDFNFMKDAFSIVFGSSWRIVLSGLIVYAVVQRIDIVLYHLIWSKTKKLDSDSKKFLWVRNNGSTIVSQLFNAILFNVIAFYNTVPNSLLISFIISTFAIYVFTSLIDTPFLYLARKIKVKEV